MSHVQLPVINHGFGKTMRRDAWWVQPAIVLTILTAFIIYATWAAFQGEHYTHGRYLSPFYSPVLWGDPAHSLFAGLRPAWWPDWMLFSPALLILPFPGLFRVTCYYYRGAYYKAFWADPPACSVGEPRKGYRGERHWPLIAQNIHRYFLYIALIFLLILAHDVWKAMWFADPGGELHFGIGVGTLVLAANTILLAGYTLGCHSMRHVAGGHVDQLSRTPVRKAAYDCSSCLNRRHMAWAWMSLIGVAFADIYVRLCSMGIWTDWRLF